MKAIILFLALLCGNFLSADAQAASEGAQTKTTAPTAEKGAAPQQVLAPSEEERKIFLADDIEPWKNGDPHERLEFYFENAELSALIEYIEDHFDIKFLLDDAVQPLPQGGKSVLGSKISFRTHVPLTKKQAWDIFVAFLDMAGLAPVPGPGKKILRLVSTQDPKSPQSVSRGPLPTYIGTPQASLPDSDVRIRYVYFVQNTSVDVIKNVVDSVKSATAPALVIFPDLRALVMTDKSASIRSMLDIIQELDQATPPETLAVVKLQRADAAKVVELYTALSKKDDTGVAARMLGQRKQVNTNYFSEGTRLIAEPRTNSVILLGSKDSIAKITDFIVDVLDRQADQPNAPLYVYPLRYTDAEVVAKVLQDATQFQRDTDAAKFGGVRDGDKYFKPISIIPEKSGNRLIINADYEDYAKLYEILQKIDIEQPQVALKVLILDVDVTDTRQLGVQLRNKIPGVDGLIGKNTNFQTSNLGQIQENVSDPNTATNPAQTPGSVRLLGDLVNLATGAQIGSTLVSFGSDQYGVWGLLQMLQVFNRVTVVANPFLVATNKYPAEIVVGEVRRVLDATVVNTVANSQTFTNLDASLRVNITPQVSRDGLVTLDVGVEISQFTSADPSSGDRTDKKVQTSVIVSNNEALALGGLIQDNVTETVSKVPVLGDIPLLGWLFKNKTKVVERSSLLILIVPEIIMPEDKDTGRLFTEGKMFEAKNVLNDLRSSAEGRDPIHRWFFDDHHREDDVLIDNFAALEGQYIDPSMASQKKVKSAAASPTTARASLKDFVAQHADAVGAAS